jgi:hypothetical protein
MIAREVADRVWALNVWKQSVHRMYEALQNPHAENRMWLAQFVCLPQFFKIRSGLCGRTVLLRTVRVNVLPTTSICFTTFVMNVVSSKVTSTSFFLISQLSITMAKERHYSYLRHFSVPPWSSVSRWCTVLCKLDPVRTATSKIEFFVEP